MKVVKKPGQKKFSKRAADATWYDDNYYTENYHGRTQWYDMLLYDLAQNLRPSDRLLELGCGESAALQACVASHLIKEDHIYGIDQSNAAIMHLKNKLPRAHISVGDIYDLPYKNNFFDVIAIMEVIEHVEKPDIVFKEMFRVLKTGGIVYLSFPNFSVFPWNIVRKFSDTLSLPSIINKQPIDTIYTINEVKNMAKKAGFSFVSLTGVTYLTAGLTPIESAGNYRITRMLNNVGFSGRSLHPLLTFKKLANFTSSGSS